VEKLKKEKQIETISPLVCAATLCTEDLWPRRILYALTLAGWSVASSGLIYNMKKYNIVSISST
jgi:hypothetical protein